jgi:ribosome-associated protein
MEWSTALLRHAQRRVEGSMPLEVTPALTIEDVELHERFVRASGPGGQNVNKVASAVELRFDAARSPSIAGPVLARLRTLAGRRMTDEGIIVIDARAFRTQAQNREDARQRLADLIRRALVVPKRRRKTRPTVASKHRRLETKRRRSETKQLRGRSRGEE